MKEKKWTIGNVIWRLVLLIWALGIVFPLFWVLYESLKTNREFFMSAWAFPEALQWQNYVNAWNKLNIGRAMFNTLYFVGGSLVLGIFVTTLCAYTLTRLEWKGRKFILATITVSLFLPGINALVPQYVMMRSMHLINKLTGLILFNSLGISVFDLLVLSGFMQTIPKELEESAFMDGASIFKVFAKVVAPLAKPGIVTIAIFRFLGLYNEFLGPFIFVPNPKKAVIGVAMYTANARMMYKADWVTLFAGVVITMIPTIALYIIFQKQIVEGATIGGVKG